MAFPWRSRNTTPPSAQPQQQQQQPVEEFTIHRIAPAYKPDIDQMADILTSLVMRSSRVPLGWEHYGPLLHVLEGYRNMREELGLLHAALQVERERRQQLVNDASQTEARLQRENERYRTMLKLVQTLLEGTRDDGLSDTLRAQMESVLGVKLKRNNHGNNNIKNKNKNKENQAPVKEAAAAAHGSSAEVAPNNASGWNSQGLSFSVFFFDFFSFHFFFFMTKEIKGSLKLRGADLDVG